MRAAAGNGSVALRSPTASVAGGLGARVLLLGRRRRIREQADGGAPESLRPAGRVDAAREGFDGMPRRDVVSWNYLMIVLALSGAHGSAVGAFVEMRRQGFQPDRTSFSTVLSAWARLAAPDMGRCVHGLALRACSSGFVIYHQVADAHMVFEQMLERNVVSWTAMIKGYLTVHEVGMAFQLFNLMPVKNYVSWCVMIGGFVNDEKFSEAVELFNSLMRNGEEVTNAILVKVVNAFAGY
ncbi:hypothetical protein ABZP36_023939 [Zizania latifolia]